MLKREIVFRVFSTIEAWKQLAHSTSPEYLRV